MKHIIECKKSYLIYWPKDKVIKPFTVWAELSLLQAIWPTRKNNNWVSIEKSWLPSIMKERILPPIPKTENR